MLVGYGSYKDIRKWKKQRAERGFSDYDVYDINYWFMLIIPEMLSKLIEHNNGYPISFQEEYIKENNLDPLNISPEEQEKMGSFCFDKWTNVLLEMKQAFLEGSEETCSYKNKYEEEYNKAFGEFTKVYGVNGELLKGNVKEEHIKDKDGNILETRYRTIKECRFEDMNEYNQKINDLYVEESKKINGHIQKNKKKALDMFVKYFDDLWW